ncbi:MAG: hypothetical protein GXO19_00310 [Epsilonproteobacteria bacterium]|nr:hypothetical protein [Campylobacterota bacterium]NPA56154.1 hypothetical protein [Campylobacterota bacterium]
MGNKLEKKRRDLSNGVRDKELKREERQRAGVGTILDRKGGGGRAEEGGEYPPLPLLLVGTGFCILASIFSKNQPRDHSRA